MSTTTRARCTPRTTAAAWSIIWSRVIGSVVSWPWMTLEALSPTSTTSIPALSRIRANEKSYPVSIAIFSPRAFISDSRAVVTRRRLSSSSPAICVDMWAPWS